MFYKCIISIDFNQTSKQNISFTVKKELLSFNQQKKKKITRKLICDVLRH